MSHHRVMLGLAPEPVWGWQAACTPRQSVCSSFRLHLFSQLPSERH